MADASGKLKAYKDAEGGRVSSYLSKAGAEGFARGGAPKTVVNVTVNSNKPAGPDLGGLGAMPVPPPPMPKMPMPPPPGLGAGPGGPPPPMPMPMPPPGMKRGGKIATASSITGDASNGVGRLDKAASQAASEGKADKATPGGLKRPRRI